jgi:hypothetical protein
MKAINARESLTDREREEFEQEKTIAQLQADYQLRFKQLEIDLQRQEMRWAQLYRLPFAVLMVPVRFMFGIGYIAHAIRGTKPDDKFWDYLRHL